MTDKNKITEQIKKSVEEFDYEILYSFPCTVRPGTVIGYAESVDGEKNAQFYKGRAENIKSHITTQNKALGEVILAVLEELKKCSLCSDKMEDNKEHKIGEAVKLVLDGRDKQGNWI